MASVSGIGFFYAKAAKTICPYHFIPCDEPSIDWIKIFGNKKDGNGFLFYHPFGILYFFHTLS